MRWVTLRADYNVDGLTIYGGTIDSTDQAVNLTNVVNFVLRDLTITNREDPSIAIAGGIRGQHRHYSRAHRRQ